MGVALLLADSALAAEERPSADPIAQAAELHRQAESKLAAGDWAGACSLYDASQALDPSAPTQGRIAQCLEHSGKLASAWHAWERALQLVAKLDPARQQLLAERIPRHMAELDARVPQLELVLAPELAGAELSLDGAVLGTAELAGPLRVDPGSHALLVAAPRFEGRGCLLRASEGVRLVVQIAAGADDVSAAPGFSGCQALSEGVARISLAPVAARVSAPQPALLPGSPQRAPVPASSAGFPAVPVFLPAGEQPPSDARRQRWLAYTLGGAGAASLAVAAGFGIRTLLLVDAAGCNERDECDARGLEKMRAADRSQTAGLVAAGAGAVLAGAGLTLLLLEPAQEQPGAAAQLSLSPLGICWSATW